MIDKSEEFDEYYPSFIEILTKRYDRYIKELGLMSLEDYIRFDKTISNAFGKLDVSDLCTDSAFKKLCKAAKKAGFTEELFRKLVKIEEQIYNDELDEMCKKL